MKLGNQEVISVAAQAKIPKDIGLGAAGKLL